jgi:hypothetical protein
MTDTKIATQSRPHAVAAKPDLDGRKRSQVRGKLKKVIHLMIDGDETGTPLPFVDACRGAKMKAGSHPQRQERSMAADTRPKDRTTASSLAVQS